MSKVTLLYAFSPKDYIKSSSSAPLTFSLHDIFAQSISQTFLAATPVEIVLAGVLLLLCLFLVVSALPMFVLAWKGKASF